MAQLLAEFADIITASGSPLALLALLSLLVASLAYVFFRKDPVRVRLGVFALTSLLAFLLGSTVVKAYATDPDPPTTEEVPSPVEAPVELPPAIDQIAVPPKRYLVPLDGQQSKSIAYWAGGTRSATFDCPREVPEGFDLVVVSETTTNIGRRRGRCVASGAYCDSTTEYCEEVYFEQACYVNRDWLTWYKSILREHNLPYSKSSACADGAEAAARSDVTTRFAVSRAE